MDRAIRGVNPYQKVRYTGSQRDKKRVTNNLKLKFASIVLAAGIATGAVGTSLISSLAESVNEKKNTKQAIITAQTTERYLQEVKGIDVEEQLKTFNSNVNIYNALANKKDRTVEEEQELVELAKAIYNSQNQAVELRTAMLKTEIAEAKGITDPETISKIKITCIWHRDDTSIAITLPDGTVINQSQMDSKLQEEIKNTKRPLKKDHENADTMTIKELEDATRDVISYYNDIEYSSDYNVELSNTLFGNEKLKSVEERE